MIDRKNFFDQPVKMIPEHDYQGDNYTTTCLLDYIYLKNHYKIIAIDLSK